MWGLGPRVQGSGFRVWMRVAQRCILTRHLRQNLLRLEEGRESFGGGGYGCISRLREVKGQCMDIEGRQRPPPSPEPDFNRVQGAAVVEVRLGRVEPLRTPLYSPRRQGTRPPSVSSYRLVTDVGAQKEAQRPGHVRGMCRAAWRRSCRRQHELKGWGRC